MPNLGMSCKSLLRYARAIKLRMEIVQAVLLLPNAKLTRSTLKSCACTCTPAV